MGRAAHSRPAPPSARWRTRSRRAGQGRAGRRRRRDARRPVVSAAAGRRVRIVTDRSPEALDAHPPQHGASAGGGGDQPVPGHAVRHRSGHRRRLLLRLHRRRVRSCRRISRRSRQKMLELAREGPRLRAPAVAARGRQGVLRGARRAVEGPAHRREDRRANASVSCYTIKDKETFIDFCVGPHVPSTGKLKAFKLMSTSNAYWKGDARNPPMQRVYGTAFLSEKDLKAHLTQIEEAKKRDHRKLGRGARPVHVPPVGSGRRVLAGQGHDAVQHPRRTTCARCCSRPATSR